MHGFQRSDRLTPLAERRIAAQLRQALAVLPEPWLILISRRPSATAGPPWVRFVGCHPQYGIALIDVRPPDAAVAPLEDFLAHTGFRILQPGLLPIVPVGLDSDDRIAEQLAAAFAGLPPLGNPRWCEPVIDLLLATRELMLARLARRVSTASMPAAQSELPLSEPPRRAAAPWQPPPVISPRSSSEPSRADAMNLTPDTATSMPPVPGPRSRQRLYWPVAVAAIAAVAIAIGAFATRYNTPPVASATIPQITATLVLPPTESPRHPAAAPTPAVRITVSAPPAATQHPDDIAALSRARVEPARRAMAPSLLAADKLAIMTIQSVAVHRPKPQPVTLTIIEPRSQTVAPVPLPRRKQQAAAAPPSLQSTSPSTMLAPAPAAAAPPRLPIHDAGYCTNTSKFCRQLAGHGGGGSGR